MVLLKSFPELLVTLMLLGKRWILGAGWTMCLCHRMCSPIRGAEEAGVLHSPGPSSLEGDVAERASFSASFSEIFWAITRGVGTERGSFGCSAGGQVASGSFLGWASGSGALGREGDTGRRAWGTLESGSEGFPAPCFLPSRTGMSFFPLGSVSEKEGEIS
jgi:hypothetical protein